MRQKLPYANGDRHFHGAERDVLQNNLVLDLGQPTAKRSCIFGRLRVVEEETFRVVFRERNGDCCANAGAHHRCPTYRPDGERLVPSFAKLVFT